MVSLKGISHGDEMLYLFPLRENISPSSLPTKEDEQIRQTILRIFVDFARFGYFIHFAFLIISLICLVFR